MLDNQVSDAHGCHGKNEGRQMKNKESERPIVAGAHTSSNPHTVVVKFQHTIIAHVAVGNAGRSENVASFAKLKVVQHWRMH